MLAGMSQAAGARDLAFVLDARIKLDAFDGDDERLLADVETLYRFACHFGGTTVLSHQLLGVSMRSLMSGTIRGILAYEPVPPETLAILQERLKRLRDRDHNVLDFTLERLVWLDGIQRISTDEGDGHGRIPRTMVTQRDGVPNVLRRLIDPMTPQQNTAFPSPRRQETTRRARQSLGRQQGAAGQVPR